MTSAVAETDLLLPKIDTDAEPLSKKWVNVASHISKLTKLVANEREAKTLPQSPILMQMLRLRKIHGLVHMFESYREVVGDKKIREAKVSALGKDAHSIMKGFEMDTHMILNHAYKFLMIHQRSNFDAMFGLYAGLLRDCLDEEKANLTLACGIDFTSFSVLKSLLRTVMHMNEFEEDRMMAPIKKNSLLNLVIEISHARMKSTRAFAAAAAVMFLDVCLDAEAFSSEPDAYVSKENKTKLIELNEYVAKPLYKLEMLKKKARHVSRWAQKFGGGELELDDALLKEITENLSKTAKMKEVVEKPPTKNQLKYGKKKRANIIF
mmetsp:Transcript_6021/g.8350  ORF Transcript_6021/g.8350 Transcript_6021/m.8350 type:complete len:322 (-) Transcript_6021:71-1036(-)